MKVTGPLGVFSSRAVDSRAALSILSPPVVTAKAAYRFLQNPQQREEVADPAIHQHGQSAIYMVARLLCSNAKAGARLTLNTDRLSTGTT